MTRTLKCSVIAFLFIFPLWACRPAFANRSPLGTDSCFKGGNGAGESVSTGSPQMYRGGNGKGDFVLGMSGDLRPGYSTTVAKVAFSTQPSNSYAGAAFATQPVVHLRDQYDNLVPTASSRTVDLFISNDPAGSSILMGTTSMTTSDGIADFQGHSLAISRVEQGFTLLASSAPLTAGTSSSLSVLSPILVTAPNNADEIWPVDVASNVTWNAYGSLATGQNKVEFSTDSGTSWTTVDSNAGPSPYSWVPHTTTTHGRIRISNSVDPTFTDMSDNDFRVAGSLSITFPNGAEKWVNGIAHTIQWATTGTIENVSLDYSSSGVGGPWTNITPSVVNDNQYQWTPAVVNGGTNFFIRVIDASDNMVKDTSNGAFTVQKINISSPTVGQRVQANSTLDINWSAPGLGTLKIEYSRDGSAWTPLTNSISASNGTFAWAIPSNFATSVNMSVRFTFNETDSDGNYATATSSVFTIYGRVTVTAPNGSEEWPANTSHDITWTTNTGAIPNVKIEYSTDNFSTNAVTIVASMSNTGTYAWTPTNTGSTFKIRLSDAQDSQTSDVSNNFFSVIGIGITAPTLGDTWNCASSRAITWNYTGSFNYVKIEFSTDNGANWSLIKDSTGNTRSYQWSPITLTPSGTALVKISNAQDLSMFSISNVFNLKAVLAVTAPSGGSVNVGTSTNITWAATGTVSNVKLEYFNGASWVTVVGSTPNTGTYSWTVPDTITASASVRVTDVDAGHPISTAQSASSFTIQSNIVVTSPAGGVNWAVGETTHNITWTNTGTVGQVMLYYATSKDAYLIWSPITSSAIVNNNSYSWTIPDIIQGVGQDPQTNPTLAVEVKVVDATAGHPATTKISSPFNVIYYTITFTVRDSQTQNNLSGLSASCTSGWSASGLTSGINTSHKYAYGTYSTVWSRAEYTDTSVDNWTADLSKIIPVQMTLSAVASQEYHVFSNFTYDAASDSYIINSWMERSGAIITAPTSCDVGIEDRNGTAVDINGADAGNNLTSASPNANGVFRQQWNLSDINRDTTYFGKVKIIYLGGTYTSNVTYMISVPTISAVQTAVNAIQTSVGTDLSGRVDAIQTSVGAGLAGKVDAIQTAVGADQGGQTLVSKVSDVLTNTGTNIPATIVSELKKGTRSKILNRATTVDLDGTVTISYKTDSGKVPAVSVYDATNVIRVSNAVMTEIGTTGVYQYNVTFAEAWGLGDYTIICSEPTTASADSMIMTVGNAVGIDGVEMKIDALTEQLNAVDTNVTGTKALIGAASDTADKNTLYGKLAGASSNVSTIMTDWSGAKSTKIINNLTSIQSYLGAPSDAAGRQTVFGKISDLSAQTGTIPSVMTNAANAYNELQDLRKEINMKGRSETAYGLLKNLSQTMDDVAAALGTTPEELRQQKLSDVEKSVEETRQALEKTMAEAGITPEAAPPEKKKGPATMQSIQKEILDLKATTEAIKTKLQEGEESPVKSWFEKT